jgi:hypothetical protein
MFRREKVILVFQFSTTAYIFQINLDQGAKVSTLKLLPSSPLLNLGQWKLGLNDKWNAILHFYRPVKNALENGIFDGEVEGNGSHEHTYLKKERQC